MISLIKTIWAIAWREMGIFARRPMFLFSMMIVPVTAIILFTSVMANGLPTELPAGLVDEDNTQVSRTIARTLDAMGETNLVAKYASFHDAREAMQRGEIYAFFHIPEGTTRGALSSRQPSIAFYTNESFFLPGSLLMKDMRLASELMGISITRSTLTAKGATDRKAMALVQPIVLESHPMNNPWVNYGVCLSNIIIPGLLILIIMLSTSYTLGMEWKMDTQKELYELGGGDIPAIIVGKLLPQTVLYMIIFVFMDVYLYRIMGFPCHCGIGMMVLLGFMTILAVQGLAIFVCAIFAGMMRFSMSVCSLLGVVSMSIAGYTFPVSAMDTYLQHIVGIFPLRHYYLIYVNQALNGYSIQYVWVNVVAIIIFMLLPLLVNHRLKKAFLEYKYKA